MRYVITGGAGFIGSHLSDYLLAQGHQVKVYDNLRSGFLENLDQRVEFVQGDINSLGRFAAVASGAAGVFHLAAIARTPWCMEDPILAAMTNAQGTVSVLEACKQIKTPRVVSASSNVVYAAHTPYRATKEMVEMWTRVYVESFGLSAVALRFSNVYGKRQSELGPSPNVFAAFRKSKREKGYVEVTGDGEQTRDFTHVSDIVRGIYAAMLVGYTGQAIDLCTGRNVSMNYVVRDLFHAPIRYLPERDGDVKHIIQSPENAFTWLGWSAKMRLEDGIGDVL